MNILLIALDTQRRDHLSCYGYPRDTSPTLDELAAQGVLFQNCVTHTAHTMPTFTTMMTGQAPCTHGIVGTLFSHPNEPDQRLDDTTPVLAEILRDNGYLTAAFDNLADFGCYPSWFVRGHHWYVNTWAPQARHPSQVLAGDINARLLPWLEAHAAAQPWYGFVHYWDPHQAYNQPEPYRSLHRDGASPAAIDVNGRAYIPHWGWVDRLGEQSRTKIDLYNGELSYVDQAVLDVLEVLRSAGVYDDTTVIVTADHGEDMEEHNAPFEHREPYETTVGIPLIVKPALALALAAGQRVPGIVGHIDLLPSILDMAGIDCPERVDGTSWLPMMRGEAGSIHETLFLTGGANKEHGRWVTPETAVRTQRWKYIRRGTATYHDGQTGLDISNLCAPPWRGEPGHSLKDKVDFFNSLPRAELYDLSVDPCETTDIIDSCPDQAAELDLLLRDFVSDRPERFVLG